MPRILYTNNATTQLSAPTGVGDASLLVVAGALFPTPTGGDYAYLTLVNGGDIEIVKLIARAGNVLTVERAQDGTVSKSFPAGSQASLRIVRAGLADFYNQSDAAALTAEWAGVTGKPSTFTPSAHTHVISDVTGLQAILDNKAAFSHTHAISDVTGLQTALDGKAATSHTHAAADITSGTFNNARIAASNVTQHNAVIAPTWANVSGKPSTFTPSAHTHAAADITSGTFNNARIAASNVTQHNAVIAPTWANVSGKPSTFTPSVHTHAIADVTGLQTALDSKANLAGATFTGNVTINSPNILSFGSSTRQMITLWGTTFGIGVQNSTHYFRTGTNGKFSWFMNGVHSNTENDPGAGGTVLMKLSSAGLDVGGNTVWHAGNFTPSTKADLAGANFTGNMTLANTQPTFDMVESDTTTGALRVIVSGGISYLQSGTTVSPNGGLYLTGKTANDIGAFKVRHSGAYRDIWHAGNFDPATKANLTGATFTGNVGANSLVLPAGIQDYYWTNLSTDIDGLIPGTGAGRISTSPTNAHYVIGIKSNDVNDGFYVIDQGDVGTTGTEPYINLVLAVSRAQFRYQGNDIWHAGNDGAGSGLNADLLDGYHVGTSGATVPLLNGTNTFSARQTISAAILLTASTAPTWDTNSYLWAESGFGIRYDGFQHRWDYGVSRTEGMRLDSGGVLTIGGNIVWHAGNDGAGSGLNADLLDGENLVDNAATANTVAGRDGSGDIHVRLIRETFADQATISGGMVFRVNNSTDNFLRVCNSPTAIRTYLGVGTGNSPTFNSVTCTGSVIGATAVVSSVSGTLIASHANRILQLTGNITIPNSVFKAGDITILNPNSAGRTITRGSGVTMYVGGANVASATAAIRGTVGIRWESASICYLTGDVS